MGSNPQSDPRIFPEIPGFSRSLTHGLTHGVFYRPTLFACTEIPKKPEATGSAGRCEPGVGRFTDPHPLTCFFFTPSLLAIFGDFSTLPTQGRIWLLRAWNGSFPHPGEKIASQALTGQRNSVLFRRKRRVLRTRGFLSDQAIGLVLHTGRNRRGLGSCCWAQKSRCPVLSDSGLVVA